MRKKILKVLRDTHGDGMATKNLEDIANAILRAIESDLTPRMPPAGFTFVFPMNVNPPNKGHIDMPFVEQVHALTFDEALAKFIDKYNRPIYAVFKGFPMVIRGQFWNQKEWEEKWKLKEQLKRPG